MAEGTYRSAGYAQYTALAAAIALSAAPSTGVAAPIGAYSCYLQAEVQDIRFRDDGTAPTAAIGFILYAGDPPLLFEGNIDNLRFIEVAVGAKLNVMYGGL